MPPRWLRRVKAYPFISGGVVVVKLAFRTDNQLVSDNVYFQIVHTPVFCILVYDDYILIM